MVERDEDGFLDRWSRRKRGETSAGAPESETAEAGRTGPLPADARAAAVAQPESQESPDAGDPEVVAKLPDIDSLTEDSDFTAFLQDGVPDVIRRKALRRLWRLNPIFANLDGLNDYDEDFSALGMVAENIKTIYKVCKGYLDDDEDKDKVEDEDEDETEDETEDEIAADEVGEDETGRAEGVAEPALKPEPSNPSEPIDSTKVSLSATESGPGQAAGNNREPESVKPARGSALARRWGGSPDEG
jgi:hypothetical protein